METVALLYEDYQKELAEDFKNTFLKRASDTDSSRSNDTVIDEVTDMLSTNIAVYTEKLLQRWGFSSGGEGGGGGDVTVTLDDLLKKYLSDNYVTIKGDQEVFGEKDFRKGIRIAGRRLYWDEGNDALVIEGAAYTTRWLSAKGVSPGGGGAGSGGAAAMYQLIDVSPNDTKDAVLGAEKDYVLTFDGSFWRGMPNKGGLSSKLFTALDKEGNEVNPDDENAEIYAIRANYSLWSVGFLSAKGISDGGTGGGGGGAVALYQLLDVEKNADITGVAGATKGSVLTFNGDKWYADKPKTAAGISNLFTALDNDGNEVDLNDESKLGTITNIRANYALWSVDWISAKGKSSGGSGGGGGLINLVYGFESLGGTFDNNDNSATFNAFTINEIWKLASSGLTNVTVTGSGNAVTDVIKGSDGRSLTFTKGSTFATKSEFDALNTKFNDFLTGSDADDIINKWSELEVFLQGMKESDNLAVILQSKMDKTAFSKLFTALDASGNEVDPSDGTKTIASIRANFGFWGVDYVSAKGVSKGSGGTGGASTLYQLVDVLANDTEDGVEGAAAGKALVFDGTHWRAGDAGLNESQLYSYLTANKYLTQSAADGRYVTSSRKVIAGTGLSGGGALTSDVTLSLGTSGVVAGTYTKVMVDAYGRVTSGTNLSATDIPNLDWSKITTGKPTTLAGYGITDAVTLTTAQTISGRKTFSQNIVFNNNGGITYTDSNVVLRNSDGHTILASFGNGEINLRPNGHNNTEGAVWINKAGNVQAPSVSTNTITIGDAQLVYDSKNKALRVKHRTDGNTVGFYSDGWITALGVQTGGAGGGSGVIKTVYSFANLTDGTTFSDSDLNNTFNAYTVKEIWKMAKEGGGIKNIAQSGSGNAVTDMTLSSDGKTITAVFGETFARQQDLGTLNNTVTQLSNKLNNFLEGLTGNDTLTELLALKADKTITISAGTGLTGGGNLSANRTLSLATTGVKAGTYTKVTVDTYGRVTVGGNPTTLAGYGITDAYTKTEADRKYVTIATPQTITGQKTFTKNIAMNSGIGLSYSGNTVFRNTSGNTVISSYGDSGMLYFRPNGDTSDVGVVQINKQGHINGVSAGFKGGVSAARLSATEYVQIGDAYLKWDAANNAVYVIKKDGTTPVGFYSTDWLSAKGLSMPGAQTGTLDSLNDVEITDPTNGQALKYDAASKKWVNGTIDSFNVNQMWAELKKADSSKVIDASHIPTSVLDGRWVKKAGDTMTGTLTSASSSGSIVFKGVENCDITNIYKDNGVIRNDDGGLTSIRNGLRFNWYNTYWYIGNLRGGSTESAGFGVVDHNNKLVLRVTPNDVRAPRFMSTVATGLSPLIVSSNTTVDNLSADLLDGYHAFGTSNALIKYGYTVGGTEPAWCRIATYSIRNTETMTDVCFVLHSSFSDLFGLLVVKTRGTAVVEGLLIASYNINRSNIRIYHDAEKKNIELYCYGGSAYSIIQANLLYSHDRKGGANTNITLYRADTKAPSWSTYVNPGFANLQNSSEMAKKLQTPRTLWGQSFDGSANVSGNMTGVGSINMSGVLTIANSTYNKQLVIRSTGSTAKNQGEGIWFRCDDAPQEVVLRHEWYDTFVPGYGLAVSKHDSLEAGDANMFFYNTGRFIAKAPQGTSPYQCVSTTLNVNLNADLLDGLHENSFLRHRDTYGIDGYNTLWAQIGIRQYNNAKPDGMTSSPYIYGAVISLPSANARFDIWYNHYSSSAEYGPNGIQYRSGWGDDKKPWRMLLDNVNYASYSDGRYVKKAGDTMTGDLTMNNTKGFYFPHGTRVVKTSGNWIHGGADAASSADANLRFGSWYGIGWYPTFSGGSVAQGNNAMWLNVRNGNLDTHGAITAHTNYLAANWDSARRLVLGGGSSYAYIDSRNSSNNVLCNIVLKDNKVVIGNYAESSRFVSTVGTGKQPYQCNSTTLNTNLNADLLDGQHGAYYQKRTYDGFVSQYNNYDYIEFLRFVIPTGQTQLRAYVIFDLCRVETGGDMNGRAVLRIRRDGDNNAGYIFYVTNFGRSWLPELRCTTNDGITWRVWMKCVKDSYDPYIAIKIVEQYPYGYVTTQGTGTTGTPSGSKYTVVAGIAGLSNAANIWTNARTFYIQDHNASHTGAGVSVNGSANVYLKLPNSIQCSDWFRSTGNSGWYHQDYGGGWYMQDSTYIRNYGSKRLRIQTDTYDTLQLVRSSGSGGSSIAFYNGGGTFRGQLGVNASSWFSFDTGTATANINVVEISPAGGIHSKAEITAKASGSDIRLKKDIQNYNAMNIINRFRSVKYHWNDIAKANSEVYNNDYDQFGLIAQDLIAGGFGQWVRDVFHDYYTVTYERLIPVVWKGLQEVDDEVTKLKKEVTRLNKRVKELEKSLCA